MGEFLADGDVCGDAAVEEIIGKFTDNGCHGRLQCLKVVEYGGAQLQVNSGTPGECFMGH
ncbi:hypothetical protein JCM15764A_35710 [Geotalea toluenoxydans]